MGALGLKFGAGPTCRGYLQAEGYLFTLVPQVVASGAGGTPGTSRDLNTLVVTGSNVDSVFSARFVDAPNDGSTITNLTPGVAIFLLSETATWVSNGIAQIQVSHPVYGTSLFSQMVQRQVVPTVTKCNGYIAGSMAADLSSLIDTAIVGVTASNATTARFSSFPNNTRNAGLWCKSVVDDTAITREADTFTLNVLIGPKHVLYANHVGCGGQLGFVGSDGVGYVATVVSSGNISGITSDIGVAYVRDATAGEIASYNANHSTSKAATQALSVGSAAGRIKPFAMLPSAAYATTNAVFPLDISTLPNYQAVPVFHTTQNNCIGIWEITAAPRALYYNNGLQYQNEFEISQPAVAARAPFGARGNVGGTESGDITFTAIPAGSTLATANPSQGAGYPILLGTTHGSPNQAAFEVPWCALSITAITTLMQSLAQAASDPNYSTYAPLVLSTTGYTSY